MTTTELRTGRTASDTQDLAAGAARTPNSDQRYSGAQRECVAVGSELLADQPDHDAHGGSVGEAQAASGTQVIGDSHDAAVATGPTSPAATLRAMPTFSVTDPLIPDTQRDRVGDASAPPASAKGSATPMTDLPVLADPFLALAADVLDDLERVRIANENRLRQLTRTEEDSDGEERGFGLTEDHPDVARLAALVKALADAEHQAELNLKRQLRKHPLGPWVKQARGVGEKQAARLLASIGDPYFNDLHNRPRLVSELWSYCGYGDAAAQVRRRGEKANWSANAKMRAYLVAVSIVKAGGPYREVYDAARVKYADAVHPLECKRCGPAGKPAQPGSPISAGHQHARALRMVAKAVLKDLWREAKRLHESPGDQPTSDTHRVRVAGDLSPSADHSNCGPQGPSVSGGST